MKPALNIYSQSSIPFAAALSLDTETARQSAKLSKSYSLQFREKDFDSAKAAFDYFAEELNQDSQYELLIEILQTKLTQHPILTEMITKSGGVRWLQTCSYQPDNKENFWSGTGYQSGFVTALIVGYQEIAKPVYSLREKLTISKEEENTDLEVFNKLLSYNPINQEMHVNFNNKIKAREWGIYLRKELYIGEAFSIEDNSNPGWKFKLIVSMVDETAVKVLAESADFGKRPSPFNPSAPKD